jgi:hypothetical protein
MRKLFALFALLPLPALACTTPVCRVDPDTLALPKIITFDDVASGFGPGMYSDDIMVMNGARFGERFAGQILTTIETYDAVQGAALAPLTLLPGADGENLSVVRFPGTAVLNGYGAAGFPKRDAQGEGAIAVQFDRDQSALSFELRGGEDGQATVQFLRRDGSTLGAITVIPTGEFTVAFERSSGTSDIAGFVLTNQDPQGMAIDTLRFGKPEDLS